jgi:hypothetical protein
LFTRQRVTTYLAFFFPELFFNLRGISVGALSESKILKMSGHVRNPLKLGALYRKAGFCIYENVYALRRCPVWHRHCPWRQAFVKVLMTCMFYVKLLLEAMRSASVLQVARPELSKSCCAVTWHFFIYNLELQQPPAEHWYRTFVLPHSDFKSRFDVPASIKTRRNVKKETRVAF